MQGILVIPARSTKSPRGYSADDSKKYAKKYRREDEIQTRLGVRISRRPAPYTGRFNLRATLFAFYGGYPSIIRGDAILIPDGSQASEKVIEDIEDTYSFAVEYTLASSPDAWVSSEIEFDDWFEAVLYVLLVRQADMRVERLRIVTLA